MRTILTLNPKIPLTKIRRAVETLKAQAVATPEFPAAVIREARLVAVREVLPHQEAPVPVVEVPQAYRGAVPETFPAAALDILPVEEAVQAGAAKTSSGTTGQVLGVERASFDGKWMQDAKGWWIQYADGSYPKNEWKLLPWNNTTAWYFFDDAGYMKTGWLNHNGKWYFLSTVSDGSLGAMKTGWLQDTIDGKLVLFGCRKRGNENRMARS